MTKKKRAETPQIAVQVGRAIARQRKALGKTQRKVAEEMETGVETISRLESGAILQTVDRLRQLSVVLQCPITSFFLDDGESELDIQAATLADMLRSLTPECRQKAIKLVVEIVTALR